MRACWRRRGQFSELRMRRRRLTERRTSLAAAEFCQFSEPNHSRFEASPRLTRSVCLHFFSDI